MNYIKNKHEIFPNMNYSKNRYRTHLTDDSLQSWVKMIAYRPHMHFVHML